MSFSVRRSCAVIGCQNKGVHYFPKNSEERQKWCQALRLDLQYGAGDKREPWKLRKYSRICSDHFKPSDFYPAMLDLSSMNVMPKMLRRRSVPSIFPWTYQKEEEVQVKEERVVEEEKPLTNTIQVCNIILSLSKSEVPVTFTQKVVPLKTTPDAALSDPLEIQKFEDHSVHDEIVPHSKTPYQIQKTRNLHETQKETQSGAAVHYVKTVDISVILQTTRSS